MEFAKTIIEIIKLTADVFTKNNIPFCLTGGWAVSIWSYPSATEDIDMLVVMEESDCGKVLDILKENMNVILSHNELIRFKDIPIWRNVVSLKDREESIILDILITGSDDYLKSVVDRRFYIDYEGTGIPIISLEDLIIHKLISNRKQDQRDIENIINCGKEIDHGYIKDTVAKYNFSITVPRK